ncbi:tetratricopeptide repeat protein [Salinarimonas ramus]|uniref:Exopolysaccharide production negative regulator n=1 Tax=Salinarimonas ramus TaxID=690164 RepID=A0A917Q3U2_9HYPH|nr:tetratricopeptide repeat protein [Salinarimonas ramus]GGK17538.1 exopolysaccharide production negative regulator [Salinarimonas ramus]
MRISDLTSRALATTIALGLLAGPALAVDAARTQAESPFASVRDALRTGMRDYNAGDKASAVRALEFAAVQGDTLAQWKLGRMYAAGDGVTHDDLKAFEYFSKIADGHAEQSPDALDAGVVSNAFVALGAYFLDGIPGTYVRRNPARAHEMFSYAASWFGDADAQYNLARLYLDGNGVETNARIAARWLHLAAEKGHVAAQAVLGNMLVTGDGVPRQRSLGLMWLTLARDGAADSVGASWIADLHADAFADATESDRRGALAYLERHLQTDR